MVIMTIVLLSKLHCAVTVDRGRGISPAPTTRESLRSLVLQHTEETTKNRIKMFKFMFIALYNLQSHQPSLHIRSNNNTEMALPNVIAVTMHHMSHSTANASQKYNGYIYYRRGPFLSRKQLRLRHLL